MPSKGRAAAAKPAKKRFSNKGWIDSVVADSVAKSKKLSPWDFLLHRLNLARTAVDDAHKRTTDFAVRFRGDPLAPPAIHAFQARSFKLRDEVSTWYRIALSTAKRDRDYDILLFRVERANRYVGWCQCAMSTLGILSVSDARDLNRAIFSTTYDKSPALAAFPSAFVFRSSLPDEFDIPFSDRR